MHKKGSSAQYDRPHIGTQAPKLSRWIGFSNKDLYQGPTHCEAIKKKMWYDCLWDYSTQKDQIIQKWPNTGHCTALVQLIIISV